MSDELRIALIGTGVMGADHAVRVAERVHRARIASVCDLDAVRAGAVADRVGARVDSDPLAAIAAEDIDAVLIVSPGPTHRDLVLAALERRLPTLCEKPLTPDPDSALQIVQAESALGRRLVQVGFMRRFDRELGIVREAIADSRFGELRTAHLVHRAVDVPNVTGDEFLITDCAVHEFDELRWLTGQEIAAVTVAKSGYPAGAPAPASSTQLVLVELADGRIADVELHVFAGFGYQVRVEAVFQQATLTAGEPHGPSLQSAGRQSRHVEQDFTERFRPAYDLELQRWVDAAREESIDGPDAWDGYAAAAVIEAALASQRTGAREAVRLAPRPELYANI